MNKIIFALVVVGLAALAEAGKECMERYEIEAKKIPIPEKFVEIKNALVKGRDKDYTPAQVFGGLGSENFDPIEYLETLPVPELEELRKLAKEFHDQYIDVLANNLGHCAAYSGDEIDEEDEDDNAVVHNEVADTYVGYLALSMLLTGSEEDD